LSAGRYVPGFGVRDHSQRDKAMSVEIILPKIGFAMNDAVLAEWLVADGGEVTEGTPLYSIESEKSTQEIDAPASGILKIIKPVGETYDVGTVLGEII
jgi:pyruvate/2-oxoglutarate dehydrogenase complex dihydrolipoamide acyltransferase (E2) component